MHIRHVPVFKGKIAIQDLRVETKRADSPPQEKYNSANYYKYFTLVEPNP